MSNGDIRSYKFANQEIPFVFEDQSGNINLVEWLQDREKYVDEVLAQYGAVLFRGFNVAEQEFSETVKLLCKEPVEYVYRSTPRTQVAANVYTATEYPAHHSIPLHNEEAYQLDWPMRLLFFCALPAEQGGETPIADSVKVTQRIDPQIVEQFRKKKIMYVRNYGSGVDLSWRNVFQTDSKDGVEEFCRANQIEFEWKSGGRLRTSQICQAVAEHPVSGQLIWFNQAHLFHISSLDERTRRAMLSIYKESELPRNAYYGDGSPLDPEFLEQIRNAYKAETVSFPWKLHDVMLLDNMLVCHARNPYKGKRRTLAGMGLPYSTVQSKMEPAGLAHV